MKASCPICGEPPSEDATHCACCGWLLHTGHVLGAASVELLSEFDTRRAAAARKWDLAAASRIGAAYGDIAALEVRGGHPTADEWRVTQSSTQPASTRSASSVDDLDGALGSLVDGDLAGLIFVECTPEHLTLQRAVADRNGVPRLQGDTTTVPWPSIVAELATDSARRRFQLAGGIGPASVDRGAFDHAVKRCLPQLGLDSEGIVLVQRHAGWTLLNRAGAVIRRNGRVLAAVDAPSEPANLPQIVLAVLRRAPLADDYELLMQHLDPDSGKLVLVTRTLFSAGTRCSSLGDPPADKVEVYGSPAGHDAAAIPVLARRGADPAGWPVLVLARTELAAQSTSQLTFTLDGPGQVRVARADGLALRHDANTRLQDLLAGVPDRVSLTRPLDLVCAIELCGRTDDEVHERLRFSHELIDLLDSWYWPRGELRVGVVGYLDHHERPTPLHHPNPVVLAPAPLGPPDRVRTALREWRPVPRIRDATTAVEDALSAIADLSWRRPGQPAARVLVIVGRRPPAGPWRDGPIPGCPHRLDWRKQVKRLHRLGVHIVGLVDPPSEWSRDSVRLRDYAEQTWQGIAGEHLFRRGTASPKDIDTALARLVGADRNAFPLILAAPITGAAPPWER